MGTIFEDFCARIRGKDVVVLKLANPSLLILFPVAWFAPLLRAGIDLPLFGLSEISIVSGLQALWQSDVTLALLVTFFAPKGPLINN